MNQNSKAQSPLDKWRIPKVVPKSDAEGLTTPEFDSGQSSFEAALGAPTPQPETRAPQAYKPAPEALFDEDGNKRAIYALDTITRLFEIVEKNSVGSNTADQKALIVMDLLAEANKKLPEYLALFDSNPSDWIKGKAMNQLVFFAANRWKNTGKPDLDTFIDLAARFFDRSAGENQDRARKIVSDLISGTNQRNHVPEVISALNDIKIEEMKAEQKIYDRLEYAFDFFAENKYDVVQLIMSVNRDLVQENIISSEQLSNASINQTLFMKGRQVAVCARMVLAAFEQEGKRIKETLTLVPDAQLSQKRAQIKATLYDGTLENIVRAKSYEILKNSLSGSNVFMDAMRHDFESKPAASKRP